MTGEPSYEASVQDTIAAPVGEVFSVRLESTPTTGYLWQIPVLPSGLSAEGSTLEKRSGSEKPGDPGLQVFQFRAAASGTYQVEFVLKRSWEQTPIKTRRFTISVR
ncbi:MAG: protease inhibitor I42 family protein [Nitrospira sp.]